MAHMYWGITSGKAGYGGDRSDYICRLGKYSGVKKREDLIYSESGNLPEWAKGDARAFWHAGDKYERKNGNSFRNIKLALPHELSNETNIKLTKEYIEKIVGTQHAYTFAIHSKPSSVPGINNVHVHVMIDFRKQDGRNLDMRRYFMRYNSKNLNAGGYQKTDMYGEKYGAGKANIISSRRDFAEIQNKYLERDKSLSRVDPRSYADQGLEKKPTVRMELKAFMAYQRKGIENNISRYNDQVREFNEQIKSINRKIDLIYKEQKLIDETRHLAALRAERNAEHKELLASIQRENAARNEADLLLAQARARRENEINERIAADEKKRDLERSRENARTEDFSRWR